ncbi:MAG: adenine phosphoribosyltransferase, partial [Solirubrobacteraceae bacterium]|nr:adenine phosphoribosyltransferase [Solirubrobacteraceae bacterium]
GTARAVCELVEGRGAHVVGCAFIVELSFLRGREALTGYDVHALVDYA